MKYMSFNSSCSYAGVANLLHFEGIETEDREIALQVKLPYLFFEEDNHYLSGPLLQNAEWFDLYLNPIGFSLLEQRLPKSEAIKYLASLSHAMLGIHLTEKQKHAVIYCGQSNGKLQFLNNKRKEENTPDSFFFSEEDLMGRLDDAVIVAFLTAIKPRRVSFANHLKASMDTFLKLKNEIISICQKETGLPELKNKLSPVFRPILLDGISMLELIQQTAILHKLLIVQKELLSALKSGQESITLADCLSMDLLAAAMEEYFTLIATEYQKWNDTAAPELKENGR